MERTLSGEDFTDARGLRAVGGVAEDGLDLLGQEPRAAARAGRVGVAVEHDGPDVLVEAVQAELMP